MIKRILILFVLICMASSHTYAGEILTSRKKEIIEIEDYLNNIQYFSANFIQDDSVSRELSEGKFYLSRPGKLRLEYVTPSKILLITNDKATVYYDMELEEINKLPTKKTPIHFLVKDRFDFADEEIRVVDFKEKKDAVEISLAEMGKEENGTISLIFQKNPLKLVGIKLLNELDQGIEVSFNNIDTKQKISSQLFIFKNPKSVEERKARY